MYSVQMTIAIVFGLVGYHFLRQTLKAHADVASCAVDLKAASPPNHRHSAANIDTESDSILFYVLLEQQIIFNLIAGFAWVMSLLNIWKITLQRKQNSA